MFPICDKYPTNVNQKPRAKVLLLIARQSKLIEAESTRESRVPNVTFMQLLGNATLG